MAQSTVYPQIWIFIACSNFCNLQCLEKKKTASYYDQKKREFNVLWIFWVIFHVCDILVLPLNSRLFADFIKLIWYSVNLHLSHFLLFSSFEKDCVKIFHLWMEKRFIDTKEWWFYFSCDWPWRWTSCYWPSHWSQSSTHLSPLLVSAWCFAGFCCPNLFIWSRKRIITS